MSAALLPAMNGTRAARVNGYAKSGFHVRDVVLQQQSTIPREAVPC